MDATPTNFKVHLSAITQHRAYRKSQQTESKTADTHTEHKVQSP